MQVLDSDLHPETNPFHRFWWYVLFRGNRFVVAAALFLGITLATLVLVARGVITIGADSAMPSLYSGLIAGLLTLVTVTLSISQLILSRVFSNPKELSNELEANREFRQTIEDLLDQPSVPANPTDFMALLGDSLQERAARLHDFAENVDADDEFFEAIEAITAEAESLRGIESSEMDTTEILDRLLGSTNAENISSLDHHQAKHAEDMPDSIHRDFDRTVQLLEGVAIITQYFKTLVLQQTLAKLSRFVGYSGFISILGSTYIVLFYRNGGPTTIESSSLVLLVSVGLAVGLSPLIVLLVYLLRISVISEYTLSVGPFVPPMEKIR